MATTSLPMFRPSRSSVALLTELQALGARWVSQDGPGLSRTGGAGPSDHKALVLAGETLMIPIHTTAAAASPYAIRTSGPGTGVLERDGLFVGEVTFPATPRFYAETTADGVPYWKIATLHATDVLATTVLQSCIRYGDRETACQFCAIGQSLAAGRTIARKTPAQLAEVAEAAVRLDGVKHMVMTTGTPGTADRGARILAECAAAIAARVDLPIQAQCEPPAGLRLVLAPQGRGRRLARHAPRSRERAGPRAHHAGQGRGPGRLLSRRLRDRRPRLRSRPGEHVHPRRPRRQPRGHPRHLPRPRRDRRLSLRRPLRSDPRDAARIAPAALAVVHAGPALARSAPWCGREASRARRIRAGCGRCGACSTLKAHEGAP